MIVDEDSALEKLAYITNLFVKEFSITMETNGEDASYINGNNELQNRTIHNMVRSGLIVSNQHKSCVVQKNCHLNYMYVKYTVY